VPQGVKVAREVSALVTFAQANLIAEPFPVKGRFDVIFCRNVMIYFDHPTQQRIVRNLVERLAPTGYFFIGHSESMLANHLPRIGETVGVYRPPASKESAAHIPIAKPGVAAPQTAAAPPAGQTPPKLPPASPNRQAHQVTAPSSKVRGVGKVRARPPVEGLTHKRIVLGEWFAATEPTLVSTLLGSCVSACLFDPVAKIGGMNHFMLPKNQQAEGNTARFGVHAMELLINELMQQGAERPRLRAMVFGAAAVNKTLTSKVAAQNASFVRQFLAQEKIPIVCERLGGVAPREVYLRTDTGEAFVRNVKAQNAVQLQRTEIEAYVRPAAPAKTEEFNPDEALF